MKNSNLHIAIWPYGKKNFAEVTGRQIGFRVEPSGEGIQLNFVGARSLCRFALTEQQRLELIEQLTHRGPRDPMVVLNETLQQAWKLPVDAA